MKKQIMIVDDDPQIRDMYQAAFEMQDYDVIVSPDGEKALDYLLEAKRKPDLVMLDIMMPRINGLSVLSTIKDEPEIKDIEVIMLSAISDESVQQKAAKYGAHSYIVKSELAMSELLERVEEALGE